MRFLFIHFSLALLGTTAQAQNNASLLPACGSNNAKLVFFRPFSIWGCGLGYELYVNASFETKRNKAILCKKIFKKESEQEAVRRFL